MPRGFMCDNCQHFEAVKEPVGLQVPPWLEPELEAEAYDPTFCSVSCMGRWAAKKTVRAAS